jgi:hypothetical protein
MYKDDRPPFVLEVDDETDADISAVLGDWTVPVGFDMVNLSVSNFFSLIIAGFIVTSSQSVPGSREVLKGLGRDVTVLRRGKLQNRKGSSSSSMGGAGESSLSHLLNRLFHEAYMRLCFTVRSMVPCQVLGLTHNVSILEEGQVEILVSALVHHAAPALLRHVHGPYVAHGLRSRSESLDSSASASCSTPLATTLVTSETRRGSNASL